MAASSYAPSLARLKVHEGGYTNDPRDPGGPTNWGVTIYDVRKYVKPGASAADVRALTWDEACRVYKAEYCDALRFDELPAGVDYSIFDYGVNSGIARAGKVLRRVLGLPVDDWHVTDAVLAALGERDAEAIINAINDERLRFLKSLKTWDHFGKGWGQRVAEVKAFSLQLAASAAEVPLPPENPVVQRAGKGVVPAPAARTVISKGAGVAAIGAGGLVHAITAHPVLATLTIGGAAAGASWLVHHIDAAQAARQMTPMPNTPAVPVKAAA